MHRGQRDSRGDPRQRRERAGPREKRGGHADREPRQEDDPQRRDCHRRRVIATPPAGGDHACGGKSDGCQVRRIDGNGAEAPPAGSTEGDRAEGEDRRESGPCAREQRRDAREGDRRYNDERFYMQDASGTIARPRELLLASLAALALAILMTWPLATGMGHLGRTLSADADGQFSIWNIAWVARTIVADPAHLFDANIFYPHRTTLAYSEANLLEGALGVIPYWLSRNPWLTLNVVMLIGFASAYVGAYLLLRYLSGDARAAAAVAVVYAFCPYVMSHLSHIQLIYTGGIPLSMLMLHRLADEAVRVSAEATNDAPDVVASAFGRTARRGLALGVVLAAQGLACAYYGIFSGLMVGCASLVLAVTRSLWKSRAYWVALAIGAVTSMGLVLPFFLPYLRVQAESGFSRTLDDAVRNSAEVSNYLASAARSHAWLLDLARRLGPIHEVLFPGLFVIVLGIVGVVLALRRGTPRERETVVLYAGLGLTALWASFGPAAGLYRILFHLPAFSFLRAPARFGLIVVLALAVPASLALARTLRALPARRRSMAAVFAVALAIGDITVIPIRWYRAPD